MRLQDLSRFVLLLCGTTAAISTLRRHHYHHYQHRHHHLIQEEAYRRQREEECIKPLHFYVLGLEKNVSAMSRAKEEEEWSVSFRLVDLDTGVDTRCSGTWTVSSSSSSSPSSFSGLTNSGVSTSQRREVTQDAGLGTVEDAALEDKEEEEQHGQHAAQLRVLLASKAERQECGNDDVGFYLDDSTGLTVVEAVCPGLR